MLSPRGGLTRSKHRALNCLRPGWPSDLNGGSDGRSMPGGRTGRASRFGARSATTIMCSESLRFFAKRHA